MSEAAAKLQARAGPAIAASGGMNSTTNRLDPAPSVSIAESHWPEELLQVRAGTRARASACSTGEAGQGAGACTRRCQWSAALQQPRAPCTRAAKAALLTPAPCAPQDLADLGPDGAPRMERLWDWACPLTEGKQVACMAWNKAMPDLLAVGYGCLEFHKEGGTGEGGRRWGGVQRGPRRVVALGCSCCCEWRTGPAQAPHLPGTPCPGGCAGSASKDSGKDSGKDKVKEGEGAGGAGGAAPPGTAGTDGKAAAGAGAGGKGAKGGGEGEGGDAPALDHGGMVAFWSLKNPGYPLW